MISFVLVFLLVPRLEGAAVESRAVQEARRDLACDAVVMNLAAHPDDEDGTTLAYYRKALGATTHVVFFTRGEGGQNELGPELYEDLAALRTKETLDAAGILDTRVWFLNFEDFGYSKTAGEALRHWGGAEAVVGRLVHLIRKLRPDVIFTNHNTIDGHGHHQAVAVAAIAAFDAAGDPRAYPEQLTDVSLWQPRKLYFRVWGRDQPTVVHPVLDTIPLYGKAPVDFAADALRRHLTQGMARSDLRAWVASRGGASYRLVRESLPFERDSTSFLGGIDAVATSGYGPLHDIRHRLDSLIRRPEADEGLLSQVSEIVGAIDAARTGTRNEPLATRLLDHWDRDLGRLVGVSTGVRASFILDDTVLVRGQRISGTVKVEFPRMRVDKPAVVLDLPRDWSSSVSGPVTEARRISVPVEVTVGREAPFTFPRSPAGPSAGCQQLEARVTVHVDGSPVHLFAACPFAVARHHLLSVRPSVAWAHAGAAGHGTAFSWSVRNALPHPAAGRIAAHVPPGWRSDNDLFAIENEDETSTGMLRLFPPPDAVEEVVQVRVTAGDDTASAAVSLIRVSFPAGLRVGIVRALDTTVVCAARWLGADCTDLDSAALATGDLSRFHTIVLDARTYLLRADLRNAALRVLDWVRAGGHLVVFYQAGTDWNPAFAPYPFRISRDRVVDESAPVVIRDTSDSLLRLPNAITPEDWDGWKQERGLYFPADADPRYRRPVMMADPGEPSLETGILVADVGKGSYIFTSLVWYRELRDGHPGAFRVFANMLAYPFVR